MILTLFINWSFAPEVVDGHNIKILAHFSVLSVSGSCVGILWPSVYRDHAVGKTDDEGAADEDDKIRGKECHQKRERIAKLVCRYQQPNTKI